DPYLSEDPPIRPRMTAHVLVALADLAPGRPVVVGPVDLRGLDSRFDDRPAVPVPFSLTWRPAGLVVVDERVEHPRVRLRHVEADTATELCWRKALADIAPRFSAVGALPDPALIRSGLAPWLAPLGPGPLPGRGIQRVWIARVHDQIDCSGFRALVEHLRPRPAPVGRHEHAAGLVFGPGMARRGDIDNLRVGRMDDDAGDRLCVGEAGVRERAAAVGRFEDADAWHRRAEQVRLASPDPDDVGIRFRDRDVADAGARFVLEDRAPRRAAVVRRPDPARREADVDAARRGGIGDGDVGGAAGDVGRPQG